jgi:RNA polymerase sigma-70 factor (ECF subfamily)
MAAVWQLLSETPRTPIWLAPEPFQAGRDREASLGYDCRQWLSLSSELRGRAAMGPNSPETQELLDQARRGEAAAVEQLLASHRDGLRRQIGLRLDPALARRVDASDIVQDVLLEASRRLGDYLRDPVLPFHLWLRHIARDRMIDAHRRHRQAQRRSLDREQPLVPAAFADRSSIELAAQIRDQEPTPASAAMRQELERRLQAAVAALDEDDREIILMRHNEQLSNQDVAAVLGLSEAAASMRYLRALRRLRSVLAPG